MRAAQHGAQPLLRLQPGGEPLQVRALLQFVGEQAVRFVASPGHMPVHQRTPLQGQCRPAQQHPVPYSYAIFTCPFAGSIASRAAAAAAAARPTATASSRTRPLSCPPLGGRPRGGACTAALGCRRTSLLRVGGKRATAGRACGRRRVCRCWRARLPCSRPAAACDALPRLRSLAAQQRGVPPLRHRGCCPLPGLAGTWPAQRLPSASRTAGAQHRQQQGQQQQRPPHIGEDPGSSAAVPGRQPHSLPLPPLRQRRCQRQQQRRLQRRRTR